MGEFWNVCRRSGRRAECNVLLELHGVNLLTQNFNFRSLLIPRYIVEAMLPYIFLALLLLTAILLAQQAAQLAEAIIYADLPFSLLGSVGVALLPGVLVFSLPLATLAGIIIGYSRMGSDSEIVAMRAAGVGSWTMIWPALVIGVVCTAATTYLHLKEVPEAARDLERVALQGMLAKLDSPVEPRTFSALPRYVIYVRDGNRELGTWGRVFIFAQRSETNEVFTARSGRIDSSGEQSELVLTDVLSTKFPSANSGAGPQAVANTSGMLGDAHNSYVVERLEQLRFSINTGRAEVVQRLNERDTNADAMDWADLRRRVDTGSPAQQREAIRILNRRAALSVAPLFFSFLAATLGLRIRRGGRSVGVLLTLIVVIIYYLFSLLGESMARAGTISPYIGPWLATVFIFILSLLFLLVSRVPLIPSGSISSSRSRSPETAIARSKTSHRVFSTLGFPNLMDATLFRSLALTFLVCFLALAAIFNIFTLFELWRFIAVNDTGASLVARYLLFLLPLITVELFPATMLITVLVTYALLARRHEAIAWWASGQSVYRLMLPGFFFAIAVAFGSWLIQEHVMPGANLRQDALRARIRGDKARATTRTGRQWLASPDTRRFYSYEFGEDGRLIEPTVYELDPEAVHLAQVVSGKTGEWSDATHLKITDAETLALKGMEVERRSDAESTFAGVESPAVFKPNTDRPSQLSSKDLKSYLNAAKQRGMDVSALAVALQKKYAGPFGIVIMAFIGMPLAVSFGRKGTVLAICAAVVVGIAYWAVGGGFQQLGNHGLLRPSVAGWSPLVIFTAAGTYFLSRVRT
ncbi:MAG TPA: LptF/LptG family permease [Pyrinomonadaceae bacterium]|nr:LptF/LptG family permease [Pyrinomonadaceae bacterium]